MAVVNSDFLTGLLTNFRAIFQNDFAAASATAFWPNLAMNVNSQGQIESYNWFGTAPKMRDVTHDGVTLQGLSKYNFTITNALYKAGLEVERTALEDDKLGLIMPRVRGLGPEAARHPGELILSLFEQNPTAYDSVAFFAGTHSDGDSGTIDNLGAGTGITVAQFQADLASARAAMNRFKDDRGPADDAQTKHDRHPARAEPGRLPGPELRSWCRQGRRDPALRRGWHVVQERVHRHREPLPHGRHRLVRPGGWLR